MASHPVMIWGKSSTGKELFASPFTTTARKKEKPFIPINCAAIPGKNYNFTTFKE